MGQYGLIGTYKNSDQNGILLFELGEDGQLRSHGAVADIRDAKYLTVSGDHIVSTYTDEDGEGAHSGLVLYRLTKGICRESQDTSKKAGLPLLRELDRVREGKGSACYVAFLGDYCVSANYHEGVVCFYQLENDTLKLVKRLEFGARAGAHQVMYREGYFYVPCLLRDRLFVISPGLEVIAEVAFDEGTGPRHGCFSADKTTMWLAGELDNRLYKLRMGAGVDSSVGLSTGSSEDPDVVSGSEPNAQHIPQFVRSWRISDHEGANPAAIRLSGDGRYVYVSVREHNVIAVLDTEHEEEGIVQLRPVDGDHPRDMILSPDERFVLAANKTGGSVTCFARDAESGRIGDRAGELTVTEAVAIVFVNA